MPKILRLDEDEHIIMEVRRHWFVIFAQGATTFFIALAPLVVLALLKIFIPIEVLWPVSEGAVEIFAYALWLLALWIVFFVQWSNYYLDVWVITNKRLISVDQEDVFHRTVSNLRFERIQDIKVTVRGLIQTFLGFGDIRVQTAGEDGRTFFMANINNPDEVKKVVFDMHSRGNGALRPRDDDGHGT